MPAAAVPPLALPPIVRAFINQLCIRVIEVLSIRCLHKLLSWRVVVEWGGALLREGSCPWSRLL